MAPYLGTGKAGKGGEMTGIDGGTPGGHDGREQGGVVEGDSVGNEVGRFHQEGSTVDGFWVGRRGGFRSGSRGGFGEGADPMTERAGADTGEDELGIAMNVKMSVGEGGGATVVAELANGEE